MKSSTGMFEIAIFLCLMSVCLTVAFTSLHYTQQDVLAMQENIIDVRQIREVNTGGGLYSYMNRPGAYLDASRLAFSASTASADSRAKIRVFNRVIQPYDMYVMNIGSASGQAPNIYQDLVTWWKGFISSSQYNCEYGNSCTGPETCPTARTHTYVFAESTDVRTFDPTHITPTLAGYEMANPTILDEAKFKLRVVEAGIDPIDGKPLLEYRIYIFLGSLVKSTPTSTPKIEYRWYECVMGSTGRPWVVLE